MEEEHANSAQRWKIDTKSFVPYFTDDIVLRRVSWEDMVIIKALVLLYICLQSIIAHFSQSLFTQGQTHIIM